MTTITNLSEDDRSLIMWDVREWCDTYALYRPDSDRLSLIRSCFEDLRQWTKQFGLASALRILEDSRLRIPETFERAQTAEAHYWHTYPRG